MINFIPYSELLEILRVKKVTFNFLGVDVLFEVFDETKRASVLRIERSSRARKRRREVRAVKSEITERHFSNMRQLRQKYKKIRARHHDYI
tara:strand:+ start:454 stop:726 length:273 start_codon:yes stop_codon:yes gene_type:complete